MRVAARAGCARAQAGGRGALPHASLLYPWAAPSIGAGLVERVERAISGFAALEVTFSEIGRFPTVVWLRPEPEPEIRELSRSLAEAFPEYPRYGGLYPDPQPHVAVAISQDPAAWRRSRMSCARRWPAGCFGSP